MRLDSVETRIPELIERPSNVSHNDESLMTPALRAALDALEREFHDLVTAQALR
jgi:hypothetical protein